MTTPHWTFDRRISIGHLMTTLTLVAGMLMWGARLETRVALVEQQSGQQQVAMERMADGMSARLERIEDKLDRLTERLARDGGGHAGGR